VGHSTHALERFVELLREHGVEALADVRRFSFRERIEGDRYRGVVSGDQQEFVLFDQVSGGETPATL